MNINILGYGLMGRQIASLFYMMGYDVNVWNHNSIDISQLSHQVKILKKTFPDHSAEGTFTFVEDISKLPDTITIESVLENIDIKRSVYSYFVNNNAPYFTNSSSFSPKEISETVNAIHFFNPINLKLVEFYFADDSLRTPANEILAGLEQLGFEIVHVNPNRGYIGNFILFHEISSALKLMEVYKYSVIDINKVYGKLYSGRNIFSIVDLIGIEVVYRILNNLKEVDPSIYLPCCLKKALDAGALGRKNRTSIVNYI